jgi:hypothetical protein
MYFVVLQLLLFDGHKNCRGIDVNSMKVLNRRYRTGVNPFQSRGYVSFYTMTCKIHRVLNPLVFSSQMKLGFECSTQNDSFVEYPFLSAITRLEDYQLDTKFVNFRLK